MQWRDVVGYEGLYQVSERGDVRRIKTTRGAPAGDMFIRVKVPNKGAHYRALRLTGHDGHRREHKVAKLVALAYLGARPKGMSIAHKNGNVLDDDADNLIWLSPTRLGARTGHKAKAQAVIKVAPDATIAHCYRSAREAGRENHMSYQTVMDYCNGKTKRFFAPDGYRYVWEQSPEANALWEYHEMDGYVDSDRANKAIEAYPEAI